jgi:F0F1-type ATP synthase membrane subunit b/b'
MELNFFSFFLNNEEAFIELNPNILETNLVNILILISFLVYSYQTTFTKTLELRKKDIIETIANAQQDVVNAKNYYYLAEKGCAQSLFWLQTWKTLYEKDKVDLVNNKYKVVKNGLLETFSTTENLVNNFEKKAFISLKRYIIFVTASKILRKFFSLSQEDKSELIAKIVVAKAVKK